MQISPQRKIKFILLVVLFNYSTRSSFAALCIFYNVFMNKLNQAERTVWLILWFLLFYLKKSEKYLFTKTSFSLSVWSQSFNNFLNSYIVTAIVQFTLILKLSSSEHNELLQVYSSYNSPAVSTCFCLSNIYFSFFCWHYPDYPWEMILGQDYDPGTANGYM